MRLRFQADADLNKDVVTGVVRREPGVDFQTAEGAGLHGLDDRQVLALAAREGRILVTHDRRTMPRHFAEFIMTETSPGIFIVSQKADVFLVIDDLTLVWAASEAQDWVNIICTIPL